MGILMLGLKGAWHLQLIQLTQRAPSLSRPHVLLLHEQEGFCHCLSEIYLIRANLAPNILKPCKRAILAHPFQSYPEMGSPMLLVS